MYRTEQLEGRPHYVVPVVMMVEGVHNGSQGSLFYPGSELSRSVPLWNGTPVVVFHPRAFAGTPEVHNTQKIGTIFNTRFAKGKLRAEAWIDCERVTQVDRRVLDAIRGGRRMEVSTGVSVDKDRNSGVFNGKQYIAAAKNLQPDHLAILPNQRGACGIADGCGLMVSNTKVPPLARPVMTF